MQAAAVGYDGDEHREGWDLHNKAVGTSRPFAHFLSATEQRLADDNNLIEVASAALDEFENTCFPRTRNAIRRFVEKDSREAVEEAFFTNLSQQPVGPLVIGSVETLLGRLAGLAKSDVVGADRAYAALVKKGLTKAVLKETKQLLAEAKMRDSIAPPPVSTATQLQAAAEQREALESLKLWYIDWADTLRGRLSYHDAVRLGLRKRKGGRRRSSAGRDEAQTLEETAGELDDERPESGEE